MFGSNVLEVAIGLVFVYLLVSLLCSAINEQVIARFFALRSNTLEDGIKTMLHDPQGEGLAKEFYSNPLITGLTKQGVFDSWRRKVSKPSYISSRTFALVIQELVADKAHEKAIPPALQTVLNQAEGNAQQELSVLC
jgi:hypothetical protein